MIIKKVYENSIAEEIGLETGMDLLSINGIPIEDILDYRYQVVDGYIEVKIVYQDQHFIYEIEKDDDEDLGVEFEPLTENNIRRCGNNCIFCFVNQLPQGMRQTLYVKDDDYRTSFLNGSFITLTNLKKRDWQKIASMKLSPLYISIHAIEAELREKIMGNCQAGKIKSQLKFLSEHEIDFHGQVVLCPGINDGEHLNATLQFLAELKEHLRSLAIVPLGLTKYSKGNLRPLDPIWTKKVIDQIEPWQQKYKKIFGRPVLFLADEFYLKAGRKLPVLTEYDDFPQLENGVGLARLFLQSFLVELQELSASAFRTSPVLLITGTSAYPLLQQLLPELREKGLNCEIVAIENSFFGSEVTVAGLITGADILQQVKKWQVGNPAFKDATLLIPDVMLKNEESVFLDDMTVSELAQALPGKVEIVPTDGAAFAAYLCQGKYGKEEG